MTTRDERYYIGSICNYNGCLSVKSEEGRFWWSIGDYDGEDWEEIPETLFRELVAFEKGRSNV